jgi:hypothetical protein
LTSENKRKIKSVKLAKDYRQENSEYLAGTILHKKGNESYWRFPDEWYPMNENIILENRTGLFEIEYEKEEFEKGDIVKNERITVIVTNEDGTSEYGNSFAGVVIKGCESFPFGMYSTTWLQSKFKKTDDKIAICTNFK